MKIGSNAAQISVIVPVRNDEANLRQCLTRLRASTLAPLELLVVDDASTDRTAEVARELGATVVALEKNVGPASARNSGVAAARGDIVFFLDADVCVHPDTLALVAESMSDPSVDAVFGSYDTQPGARNFVSQYKNLAHHFFHQRACEDAKTFWTGCGAVRRHVFLTMGGFDRSFGRPSIEDIELGVRLHQAGYTIKLNKRIMVMHLKRWTLPGLIKSDVCDRGIPWTKLILKHKNLPNDLNLTWLQRASAILAGLLLGTLLVGAIPSRGLSLVPIAAIGILALTDYWTYHHETPRLVDFAALIVSVGGALLLGAQFGWWGLVSLGLAGGIVLLNMRFYAFFLRERHSSFTVAVFAMHVVYYICSLSSLVMGMCAYLLEARRGSSAPPELGTQTL